MNVAGIEPSVPVETGTEVPAADHADVPAIGWLRALLSGVLIVVVAFVGCVVVPQQIVVRLTSLERGQRAGLALVVAVVLLAGICTALRRLQARRVI